MTVWIVERGEQGEGGSVVGVFHDKEAAVKIALSQKCCFSGGWLPDGDLSWRNGCDFVNVLECEVHPTVVD